MQIGKLMPIDGYYCQLFNHFQTYQITQAASKQLKGWVHLCLSCKIIRICHTYYVSYYDWGRHLKKMTLNADYYFQSSEQGAKFIKFWNTKSFQQQSKLLFRQQFEKVNKMQMIDDKVIFYEADNTIITLKKQEFTPMLALTMTLRNQEYKSPKRSQPFGKQKKIKKEIQVKTEKEQVFQSNQQHQCSICNTTSQQTKYRKLVCKHIFHDECIKNWCKNYKNICPNCRNSPKKHNSNK